MPKELPKLNVQVSFEPIIIPGNITMKVGGQTSVIPISQISNPETIELLARDWIARLYAASAVDPKLARTIQCGNCGA